MRLLILLLAGAFGLCAADVTGKWRGAMLDKEGKEGDFRVFLILKQDGTQLTGSAGNDEYEQTPIQNGSVEGNTVRFEVSTDDALYRVALKLEGDDLIKGEGTVDRAGESEKFTVAVRRVKEAAPNSN